MAIKAKRKSGHAFLGIDWVGFSLPATVAAQNLAAIDGALATFECSLGRDWLERVDAQRRFRGVGVTATLIASQSPRLRLDLSGGFWPPERLAGLLPLVGLPQTKVHRLDVAAEPENGERFFAAILRAVQRGHYGGFQKASVVQSWDDGSAVGETVYLGSRESPTFARFYRKAGRERWRFERELKRARASQSIVEILANPTDDEYRRWIFGGLVFGKKSDSDRHLDRVKPEKWWLELAGSSFVPLPALPPANQSLDRSLAWVSSQVASTWRTLQVAGYGDRLRDIVAQAPVKSALIDCLQRQDSATKN